MGRSSSPISALCMLRHHGSQKGVQTDSWEICTGVQLDHDERKNSHAQVQYTIPKRVIFKRLSKPLDNTD